jgi:hypothetical protein
MIGRMGTLFIKHEQLDNKLLPLINNSKNVCLVVDMKTMIRKAYINPEEAIYDSDQKLDMTSVIINSILSYRHYLEFRKFNVTRTFILYSSKECDILRSQYPDYKKYYYDKYLRDGSPFSEFNKITSTAVKITKTIVSNIPGFYYIDTSDLDEYMYIDRITFNSNTKNILPIVVSSDILISQCVNNGAVILNPDGDDTEAYDRYTVGPYVWGSSTGYPILMPLYFSICGAHLYSLNKIDSRGPKRAMNEVSKLVDSKVLLNEDYLYYPENEVMQSVKLKEYNELIKQNYQVVYPKQIEIKNEANIDIVISATEVKHSTINQFKELNDKIFREYPLSIDMVF